MRFVAEAKGSHEERERQRGTSQPNTLLSWAHTLGQ